MSSRLKERLERLGPVRGVDRVASGSPVDLVLRAGPDRAKIKTIDATMALARRGMTLLRAKRAIEAMLADGEVAVGVPTVEDWAALARDLTKAGVETARRVIASAHSAATLAGLSAAGRSDGARRAWLAGFCRSF
jgi:putative transcriptional regulator